MVDLTVTWGRLGVIGFGGGPSMIPLIRAEVVDHRQWMTNSEFVDVLGGANALPGPITTKLAAYVGWEVAGAGGALTSVVALVAPSAVVTIALMQLLLRYADRPWVHGALAAVRPVAISLLLWTVWLLAPKVGGSLGPMLVGGGALLALILEVPPALVLVVCMGLGAAFLR